MADIAVTQRLVLCESTTPELVRSGQKDRYYHGYLTDIIGDIVEPILPRRYWLEWHREIQLIGEFVYYGLTTGLGNQTLGEEYCNIVEISGNSSPSLWRRLLSVSIQVFGRYALEKSIGYARRLFLNYDVYLSKLAGVFEEAVASANELHLVLFYLLGVYQFASKRLIGIRYKTIRYENIILTNPYEILGWLVLMQLVIRNIKYFWKKYKDNQRSSTSIEEPESPNRAGVSESLRCSLCLECCMTPTTPPCGHLFCWQCIMNWVSDQMQCPVCRNPVLPRQLIALQNFDLE
jgi:peroxin-10